MSLTVLRYFLERGHMAELRLPADLEEREKRRLFAHLKIDLLDEVSDASETEEAIARPEVSDVIERNAEVPR